MGVNVFVYYYGKKLCRLNKLLDIEWRRVFV